MSCCEKGGGGDHDEDVKRPVGARRVADGSVEDGDGISACGRIDEKVLIDPKMLFIGAKIGEGAHGKVYEGKYGSKIVAIKVLNSGDTPEEKATLKGRFIRQVNMMRRVKHENLVKFIGACMQPFMVIITNVSEELSATRNVSEELSEQRSPSTT